MGNDMLQDGASTCGLAPYCNMVFVTTKQSDLILGQTVA